MSIMFNNFNTMINFNSTINQELIYHKNKLNTNILLNVNLYHILLKI
jgi:hypothetical protein